MPISHDINLLINTIVYIHILPLRFYGSVQFYACATVQCLYLMVRVTSVNIVFGFDNGEVIVYNIFILLTIAVI
jgi:hypothetical protein